MRVLVVSGIWPPDVGGPASHAPTVASFLRGRGHDVEVVVTADREPAGEAYPVRWTPRRPKGVRHLQSLALVARRARHADVLYTTGLFGRSGLAALATRTPYVVKLTGDPAFERLRARGAVEGGVDDFQTVGGGGTLGSPLRWLRDLVLRRAAHVYTPSSFLRELAIGWGVEPGRVSVLPNPAPAERPTAGREELRARFGFEGPTLVFAGRLTAQKSLGVLLDALASADGVTLVLVGEGDQRALVERRAAELGLNGRVALVGARPRSEVLDLFAAADASVLSSSWENFPHTVVESLAVGTPVIATAAGGVPEVITDGENGLLVPVGDAPALAAAIRRYLEDGELRERLRAAAEPSVAAYLPERLLGELEETLRRAAR